MNLKYLTLLFSYFLMSHALFSMETLPDELIISIITIPDRKTLHTIISTEQENNYKQDDVEFHRTQYPFDYIKNALFTGFNLINTCKHYNNDDFKKQIGIYATPILQSIIPVNIALFLIPYDFDKNSTKDASVNFMLMDEHIKTVTNLLDPAYNKDRPFYSLTETDQLFINVPVYSYEWGTLICYSLPEYILYRISYNIAYHKRISGHYKALTAAELKSWDTWFKILHYICTQPTIDLSKPATAFKGTVGAAILGTFNQYKIENNFDILSEYFSQEEQALLHKSPSIEWQKEELVQTRHIIEKLLATYILMQNPIKPISLNKPKEITLPSHNRKDGPRSQFKTIFYAITPLYGYMDYLFSKIIVIYNTIGSIIKRAIISLI